MLPACLPMPANPSKTSCPSPWQCPPLPLALASSHSAQTLTPPLSPSLAHSPGSLSSLRSQPSDLNPLHLLPPPELLLSLSHLCQLLSSLTAALPTALQPCRSLLGFYKPCHHPFPLWPTACNALMWAPQQLSPALRLALCSGRKARIWPLMRLKTTWMQAEPAKKNLPTHNFEGRKEELIQMKIKRKHRHVIVLSFIDRSQTCRMIFDPGQKTRSHRFQISCYFIHF